MRLRATLQVLLTLGLLLPLAGLVVDTVRRATDAIEVGSQGLTSVTPAERAFLASLDHPARATYFVSPPADLPSNLRRIEDQVREVLDALAEAAPERFEFEIVRADAHPDRIAFATARQLSPVNVRSVRRDAYTDREIWSTLELSCGPRESAVIEGLSTEDLPHLRALLLAQLEELIAPSAPRIAFAAPKGFDALRARLAARGEVVDVDLDGGATLPDDADLLVWMQPSGPDRGVLEEVERFRARGRAVWIAASERAADLTVIDGAPAIDFRPRPLDAAALWEPFGLGIVDSPLLDQRSESVSFGELPVAVPFLVRCIAPNQDFRNLRGQPNGNLLFSTPTPLSLDGDALRERGLRASVLATSSEASWLLPDLAGVSDPEPLPIDALGPDAGRRVTKQPLLALLEPRAGLGGPLVAAASASLFSDEQLESPAFAHLRLVEVLLDELTSPERVVAARAEIARPERIELSDPVTEIALQLAVTLGVPALLLLVALLRGALRLDRSARRTLSGGLAALAGLVATALALSGIAGVAGRVVPAADLSRDGLNRLGETTLGFAAEAASRGALELEWIASPTGSLPARMRPGARELRRRLLETARAVRGTKLAFVTPEQLDPAELDVLSARGVRPFRVDEKTGEDTVVREVYGTLVARVGDSEERLQFPDPLAFEDLEFRLAFAFWRLATGEQGRIALASDLPRLSPAEALEEYQNRMLFAPSGTDVYSLARGALERAGFEVEHVDTRPRPGAPYLEIAPDVDALVWLQPRRDVTYVLDGLARHLHGGGRALVCAQHFNIQAERYRGTGFDLVFWPQPQSADIEALWLPDLGVTLERQVLFDELAFAETIVTELNRSGQERDYAEQETALPFLIRASNANFAPEPWLGGIGDQAFVWGNAIELDDARLTAAGLEAEVLIETSPSSWSFDWNGGTLPPEVLEGPLDGAFDGPRALAVDVTGPFPLPAEALQAPIEGVPAPLPPPPGEGELVLVGASEPFKNEWLLHERFRGDHLLINLVAHLTLPEELAAVAARRRVPAGLRLVEDTDRARWRRRVQWLGPLLTVALVGSFVAFAGYRRNASLVARVLRGGH
ncbi:MAG: Gldg family protein [Planctomycetota bacterium]|jgi:hypothetical protein